MAASPKSMLVGRFARRAPFGPNILALTACGAYEMPCNLPESPPRNARHRAMGPLTIFLTALLVVTPCSAQQNEEYKPGPWHYRSIPCVDTTVHSVAPRLSRGAQRIFSADDFDQSGVVVTFNTHLGSDPAIRGILAAVTHYQQAIGNGIMRSERPGDRVQVCFLGPPAPTKFCDPDKDERGRTYRIYDYRQHAQYSGSNEEHTCGGA